MMSLKISIFMLKILKKCCQMAPIFSIFFFFLLRQKLKERAYVEQGDPDV